MLGHRNNLADSFLVDQDSTTEKSEFTTGLEEVFRDQKFPLQNNVEVVRFWLLVFLYNLPTSLSGKQLLKDSYLELLDSKLVFYYTWINETDSLHVAIFSIDNNAQNNYSQISKTMADKYNHKNIKIRQYEISGPTISVRIESCHSVQYAASESIDFPEPMKHNSKSLKSSDSYDPILPWTFDNFHDQISVQLNILAELAKTKVFSTLDSIFYDAKKFSLLGLWALITSQQDKHGKMYTELGKNSKGEYGGLWVRNHKLEFPVIFIDYSSKRAKSVNKFSSEPRSNLFLRQTYHVLTISLGLDEFMMRTRTEKSVFAHNLIQNTIFRFPKNVDMLISTMNHILHRILIHYPTILPLHYLLGRLTAEKTSGRFYNVFSDEKSFIVLESFSYMLKVVILTSDNTNSVIQNNCTISYRIRPDATYIEVEFDTAQKEIVKRSTVTNTGSDLTFCDQHNSFESYNSIAKYPNMAVDEFFTCPQCIMDISRNAIGVSKFSFNEAKSILLGTLTGMFQSYSFIENYFIFHQPDQVDNCFVVEFENFNTFQFIDEKLIFWHNVLTKFNLNLKLSIVVIFLSESSEKLVGIDSICLQVEQDFLAEQWAFSNNSPDIVFKQNIGSDLMINNRQTSKMNNFHMEQTVTFSKTAKLPKNAEYIGGLYDSLIYAQLGPNILAFVETKFLNNGYQLKSTDPVDVISQIISVKPQNNNSKTIMVPEYLIQPEPYSKNQNIVEYLGASTLIEKLKPKTDTLLNAVEHIGRINFEKQLKVLMNNVKHGLNVQDSLESAYATFETEYLHNSLREYAKIIGTIKLLAVPSVDYTASCRILFGVSNSQLPRQECSAFYAKIEHNLIDLSRKKFCTPERQLHSLRTDFQLASFKCSESTMASKNSSNFHNENTLAIVRKTAAPDTVAVVQLSGKMSSAFGSDDFRNIFIAIEGKIKAIGGAKDDIFILPNYHRSMQGIIDGKAGLNTLILLPKDFLSAKRTVYNPLPTVVIDAGPTTRNPVMKIYKPNNPKESILLLNINKIVGRKQKQEKLLNIGCQIEHVELKGGNHYLWDLITVPKTPKNCSNGLRLVLNAHTLVEIEAQQERYIEYLANVGPAKIKMKNSVVDSTPGLVVFSKNFYKFISIFVEYQPDGKTRNIFLQRTPETVLLSMYNLRGQVQFKFDDVTLISADRKHSLVKNSDGESLQWSAEQNIITYKLSTGNHAINHNIFSLEKTCLKNKSCIHVFEVQKFPVTVNLDETQSKMVNVIDLRPLIRENQHMSGKIELRVSKVNPSSSDQVFVYLTDNNDVMIRFNIHPSGQIDPSTYIITDREIVKLTSEFNIEKVRQIEDERNEQVILLDKITIADESFREIARKATQENYKKYAAHGSLIFIQELQEQRQSTHVVIFWDYEKYKTDFDNVIYM